MQINYYIFFSIAGLVNLILLMLIFFSKKVYNLFENKVYIALMFCTLIGIINEIFMVFGVPILEQYHFVKEFTAKLFLIITELWIFLLCLYTMIVSNNVVKKSKNCIKKEGRLLFIIYLTCATITCMLPIEYAYNSDSTSWLYTYGLSTKMVFVTGMLFIAISLIYIIKNKTNLKSKKYYPIYAYMVLSIIVSFIQQIDPNILMISFVETIIIILMYFTIENPDVKMINELELAKNQAEKANRAKSDFISSMSHEIRTPLNAIVGFSEVIQTEQDPKEREEDAKNILMASQNLLEIVNGVLDISKIEAEKMEVIETEYELLPILENLSDLMIPRIGEKEIELKTDFAPDIPKTLYGDKVKVKQIITNLLTNAVKYTEKGIIDFKVNCINQKGFSTLRIIVSDTGRGIKKDQMDKLFTKFQRLDEDRNTTVEGTGLGLAITKSLIEMMGGNINVQSVYGSGSTFTVNLIQKIVDKTINETEEKINKDIDFSDKKILVVDDNNLNLLVANKMLKEYKVKTDLVTSGFDCINRIEDNEHYDLILMDDMMPKMSGKDTFKKLKENKDFNIPVVILTANAIKGMKENYLNIGFNDYLSKPIDKEELEIVLNKYLNNNDTQPKLIKENEKIESNDNEVYQITDEEIVRINKLLAEKEAKQDINNSKGNIYYLKNNGIDVDGSLEILGNIDMYNETLNMFVKENKTRIPRLKENKEIDNMKDYSIDVHALKSDSKYLGFKKLAELSYNHELKSKANDSSYITEHYNELIEEYNRIDSIIKKYI